MKLALKKSFNNWVKVGVEGEEFLIDYPSIEQDQKLQSIKFSDEFSGNDKPLKYFQYFLKFVIKDWKGIVDENGKPLKCKIVNNELEESIWWALVGDEGLAMELFTICNKELEFTENDKKKLSLQDSLTEKGNSQVEEKTTQ
jgi:hypothetical protein